MTHGLAPAEWAELALALKQLADEQRCDRIEIRGGAACDALATTAVCTKHRLHQYAVLDLRDPQQLWKGSLTNEARKAVKRGQAAGVRVEISSGAAAESAGQHFYQLYLVSMKRLGVPPHPRAFFQNLTACLGHRLVCAAVVHQEKRIAYLVGAMTRKRFSVYITASAPEAWPLRPNDLAHWELITWAFANGATLFDFGSARYPGQIHFKQKWGATFYDYNYYLIGQPGSAAVSRVRSVDSSSKLMTTSAKVWSIVMPLGLSSVLGPRIRKYLTK